MAEHIAAILEKLLTPEATVRHNGLLPVVGRSDRQPRQCDVVIVYGREPRTSVAIVEVQKRKRKPDITTFHGWVTKMREVGAQQLICVSAYGYPTSIINEVALRIGPTVKLMTLRELQQGDYINQIIMLPYMLNRTREFKILAIGVLKLNAAPEFVTQINATNQISANEPVFSIGADGPPISLNDLVANALTNGNLEPLPPLLDSTIQVDLAFNTDNDVWFHSNMDRVQVNSWVVQVSVSFRTMRRTLGDVSTENLVYKQESINGVVAWVATTTVEVEEKMQEFRMAFKRDSEGILTVSGYQQRYKASA